MDGGLLLNYPIKLFDREKYIDEQDRPKAARRTGYYKGENDLFLKDSYKERSPYVYNRPTLGFRLDSKREIAALRYGDVTVVNRIDDIFGYTRALLKTALNAQEMIHLHNDDWHRTVYIDTLGVGTTDFDIEAKTKKALVKSGHSHTDDYFEWFETAKGKDKPLNRI